MKKLTVGLILIVFANQTIGQTNTFPASGYAGIGTINPGWPLQIGSLYNGLNGSINGAINPNRLVINNGLAEPSLTLGYYSAGYGLDLWVGTTGLSPVYFDNRNADAFIFRNRTYFSSPTELMRINSTGLGIGSDNPTQKLFVNGGTKTNSLYIGSGSTFSDRPGSGDNIYIRQPIQTSGGYWGMHIAMAGPLASHTASFYPLRYMTDENNDGVEDTERLYLTKGGGAYFGDNVGIGTTNPTQKLFVSGGAKVKSLYIGSGSTFSDRPGYDDNIYIRQPIQTNGGYWGMRIAIAGPLANHTAPFYPLRYMTDENNDGVEDTDRLYLTKEGGAYFGDNVGIGTVSPGYKLDVNGSIGSTSYYPSLVLAAGYWGGSTFSIYSGTNTGSTSDGDFTTFINPASKGFNFRQGSSDILTIASAGNVGIGTGSPSEKLSVNGNIRAQKIIVSQTGWSDYVFNADYKLRSLSSLEAFIKENKHLPEVPSANEVEEKGISVGDNQALLLKKIEEMTLYLIQLKRQVDEQSKQIQKQYVQIKKLQSK
ncbi:MAG: hypothetical protein HYU70_09210 [Bacteroidetes bacterium]|nr:hypothetical protein [Bacteroidota bacterium]